jgi:selenocysteine lyase/cysteine desulfurase
VYRKLPSTGEKEFPWPSFRNNPAPSKKQNLHSTAQSALSPLIYSNSAGKAHRPMKALKIIARLFEGKIEEAQNGASLTSKRSDNDVAKARPSPNQKHTDERGK